MSRSHKYFTMMDAPASQVFVFNAVLLVCAFVFPYDGWLKWLEIGYTGFWMLVALITFLITRQAAIYAPTELLFLQNSLILIGVFSFPCDGPHKWTIVALLSLGLLNDVIFMSENMKHEGVNP